MMKNNIISPKGRLDIIPFRPTRTNYSAVQYNRILVEEYAPLPMVDLALPEMDHHVLILNSSPPNCEIHYKCSGENFKGRWAKNDLSLIPAFSENEWKIKQGNSTCIHFLIPADLLNIFIEKEIDVSSNGIEMDLFLSRQDVIATNILNLIHNEMVSNYYHGTTYIESLENILLSHLLQNFTNKSSFKERTGGFSNARYKTVSEYIDTHLSEKITLDELALLCNCTPHHFSRAFKRDMGITPHTFIVKKRVRAAIDLIRRSDIQQTSLATIAQLCGFTDQSHMTRHIKRETGFTPMEIKRR